MTIATIKRAIMSCEDKNLRDLAIKDLDDLSREWSDRGGKIVSLINQRDNALQIRKSRFEESYESTLESYKTIVANIQKLPNDIEQHVKEFEVESSNYYEYY